MPSSTCLGEGACFRSADGLASQRRRIVGQRQLTRMYVERAVGRALLDAAIARLRAASRFRYQGGGRSLPPCIAPDPSP
jgi:hypothetical protein